MSAPASEPQSGRVIESRLAEIAVATGFTLWSEAPAPDAILDLLHRAARRLRITITVAHIPGGLHIQRAA